MPSTSAIAILLALCANRASGWVIGKEQTETHPRMTWQRCTGKGGSSCTNVNGEIVIDANWRWLHSVGGYTNCFDGNEWNATACPDNAACTKNCAIEGSDYRGTYGITTSGNSLTLKFITKGQYSTNIGSRTYLMKDANNYEVRKHSNYEFEEDTDHISSHFRCLILSGMNLPLM
jgi:cellulose 1,4-beta-cellobiosidase